MTGVRELGLPQGNPLALPRATTGAEEEVVVARTPRFGSSFVPQYDQGHARRIGYNTVLSDIVGSFNPSSIYPAVVHAVMRSHPLFTHVNNTAFSAPTNIVCRSNFASLTYGSNGIGSTPTYILGFAEDYCYETRTSTSSTSPITTGFMIDGDADFYYIVGGANVSKVSKSSFTATLTKNYAGQGIVAGWLSGSNLVLMNSARSIIVADRDTLLVSSSYTLPEETALATVFGHRGLTQSDSLFAWIGGVSGASTYVYVLDKATLDVKQHTLTWGSGSREAHMFICDERPCITNRASDASVGRVHQYSATQMRDLFYIQGSSWSEEAVRYSGCWHEPDLLTFAALNISTKEAPGINNNRYEWSLRLSSIPSPLTIPTFTNIPTFQYQGGTLTSLTSVTKTTASISATDGTNSFNTFARHPYRTYY